MVITLIICCNSLMYGYQATIMLALFLMLSKTYYAKNY